MCEGERIERYREDIVTHVTRKVTLVVTLNEEWGSGIELVRTTPYPCLSLSHNRQYTRVSRPYHRAYLRNELFKNDLTYILVFFDYIHQYNPWTYYAKLVRKLIRITGPLSKDDCHVTFNGPPVIYTRILRRKESGPVLETKDPEDQRSVSVPDSTRLVSRWGPDVGARPGQLLGGPR